MQNALRKWLVGFGLVAALLALAVPALAQNQWQAQTTPATFPTPVEAMTVGPLNQVEAVTAGGGYPGGTLGLTYYDNTGVGDPFTARTAGGDPPGDDYTSVVWDGTWWFAGAWNTGLWDFNGAFSNPSATAPLFVNKHIQCIGIDTANAGAPYPHVLYLGSWGDGMYSFDGTTWTKLANYPGAAPAQFVKKVLVVPGAPGAHPTLYVATEGYGLLKGVWSGNWTWTQKYTADLFVDSVATDGSNIVIGTQTLGILISSDAGNTWAPMTANPPITMPVAAVLSTPIGWFAGTQGQGIYRYEDMNGVWQRIDNQGCAGGVAVGLYINDLAYEAANNTLFAGAGQNVVAATGMVYRIAFANPTTAEPANRALTVGTFDDHTLSVVSAAVCTPANWHAQITSGSLPPGMSLVVDNPPTPGAPAVRVVGTPTADCSYTVTIRVWDALYNFVDITYTNDVRLMTPTIYINVTPTPLGTVTAFSTDSPATLGVTGSINYFWNFGDAALPPAVDSTLANPTHIYTAAGSYTVTLVVSDTACGTAVDTTCPAVSPDNCNTNLADVYGPLIVDPTATIVGSGSQFQFHPATLFPMGGLPVCTSATNSGICPAPSPDPSADGYSYDWRFYNVPPVGPPPSPNPVPPAGWIAQSCDSNPIVTFSNTGGYWAWLHVTDCSGHNAYGYCVVNYNGPMSVTFASNTNPAPTGYPLFFNGTAQGQGAFGTYLADIDFGDGSLPTMGIVPTTTVPIPAWSIPYSYATPGTYTVTFTAHDDPAAGHTTVVTYRQTIYAAFTGVTVTRTTGDCAPNYPAGPVPKSVCFNVSPTGGLAPYLLSVDWGDGSTSTISDISTFPYNICHTYTVANTYAPVFYLTDSGHISVTNSATATAFTLGNPVMGHATPACQSVLQPAAAQVTIFNDTLLSPGFAATDYQYLIYWGDGNWTGWAGFAAASVVLNHNYPVLAGVQTYQPYWYIYNNKNCEQIGPIYGLTVNVYNALAPISAPTWTQACGSRVVSFTAAVPTTGVPPYTYKWDFGDGSLPITTLGPTTTHTYATNGNFNAQLTINDSASTLCGAPGNQTQNAIYLVQVVEPISGTISGPSGDIGCAPASGHFDSSMAGGALIAPVPPFQPNPALNYTWSVSPSGGVVIATPNDWHTNITFNNPGTYTISLSVQSIAVPGYVCSATNTLTVTVIGGIDTSVTPTFTVTETSGYLPLPDTFTSTYSVTDPSADVTITYSFLKNGNNYQFPVTDPATSQPGTFVAPNNYVIHPTTTFMNNTFTFVESGTYTVSMVLTDTCGNSTTPIVKVIQILEPQALSVTTQATPAAGNAPLTVTFSSFPTGGVPQAGNQYIYDWNFGDSTPNSSSQNPTHIYSAPGTYTATLTVTDYYPVPVPPGIRHTATANVTITVYAGMTVVASASTPTSGSKPLTVGFLATPTGGSGTYTYFWYFGDGATSTLQNPSHTYATAGTYFAYVVVNDTASHTATSNQVVVNAYDPLVVTANATPSAGNVPLPVTFTAQANGGDNNYTYTWNFGDSSPTATGALVNHTYTTAGVSGTAYTVTLTVVDGVGHSATKTLTVTAYQPMVAKIKATAVTGLTPFNPGFALDGAVTGGDGVYTYLWNFGDGTSSNLAAPTKIYNAAGTYSCWLTVNDGAGHSVQSNTITVKAYDTLTLAISANPAVLIGAGTIAFTADVAGGDGNYTVAWTFGDGGTGTGTTVNHAYAVGTAPNFTYTVTAVATDGVGGTGHTATKTMTVTVKPIPPTITQIVKLIPPQVPSWRLKAYGSNFKAGCVATINGTAVTTTYKNSGEIILKDCKSLCPKGVPVLIVVTNPDGGISAPFTYIRTQQP